MTQGIRDKARVDEIQRRCCMLLDAGKSWEYISAMVQLMANKESVFMKQGLLDLGADFEADMERAAQYVEKCVQELTRAIGIIKSGRRLSGKDKQTAERLGQHTTSAEASEATLNDLVTMREMFRNIGSYPDLVAAASLWDGKTELDPVGMALTRGNSEVERAAADAGMTREEWEEAQAAAAAKKAAEAATGSLGFSIVHLKKGDSFVRARRAIGGSNKAREELEKKMQKMTRENENGIRVGIPGEGFKAPDDDTEVFIMPSGIDAMLSYNHVATSSTVADMRVHFTSAVHVDELWKTSKKMPKRLNKRGVMQEAEQDYDAKNPANRHLRIRRRIADIQMPDGSMYEVKLTAKLFEIHTNTLYMVEVESVSKINPAGVDDEIVSIEESIPSLPAGKAIVAENSEEVKSESTGFSIISMAEAAKIHLSRRADEDAASDLIARWDKEIARLQVAAAGDNDGAAQYAVLLSLLESTRSVLPPKFAKLGRLNGLMKWAAVYAHLVSTGEVKRSALLKGPVFEKFATTMQQRYEGGLMKGISEDDARAVLQELGEKKLENAADKVARKCREQLEEFVKARAEERVELQAKRERERQKREKEEAGERVEKTLDSAGVRLRNQEVVEYLRTHISNPILNLATGIEVEINGVQMRKMLSNPAKRIGEVGKKADFSGWQHNYVATHIEKVFRHAIPMGEYMDKHGDENVLAIRRFACPITLDGTDALAFITVKETVPMGYKLSEASNLAPDRKLYTFELEIIEELGGKLKALETAKKPSSPSSATMLAQFDAAVKTYFEDVSKVVDENGEPLVVYHGTPATFTVFKPSKDGALGAGIYTTAFERLAKGPSQGGNIMHLFLNIKNPYEALYPGGIEQDKLIAKGYDGVYNPSNQYYVAFNPEQVKSATDNRGTFDPQEPDITFSLRDMTQAARVMLRRREDDLEGEELIARWDELLARFETASAGRHDGAARLGVLVALLESTRSVLPPEFAKLGRLHALMKWAAVYAHLVSTGEVKQDGTLKGAIFEQFVAAMQNPCLRARKRPYALCACASLRAGFADAVKFEVRDDADSRAAFLLLAVRSYPLSCPIRRERLLNEVCHK